MKLVWMLRCVSKGQRDNQNYKITVKTMVENIEKLNWWNPKNIKNKKQKAILNGIEAKKKKLTENSQSYRKYYRQTTKGLSK